VTARYAPYLPAAAVLVVWIAWIPLDGGYFPRTWYPAALFVVALVAAVVLAGQRAGLGTRLGNIALGLLAALVGWSFLSILWAGYEGAAWEAANQLLLYLAMVCIVVLVPWRAGPAIAFLGLWSVAVAVACGGELVSALATSDLAYYVVEGRFQQPTGYANATAAIAAMALWPAIIVASRRGARAWEQVAFVAVATFLACFSELPQSKAALVATVLVAPLVIGLAPERGRLIGRLVVVALSAALAARPIYEVYLAGHDREPVSGPLETAAKWIAVSVAVSALGTLVLMALERRVRPSARVWRAARVGSAGALVTVAVAALAIGALRAGAIADEVDERWQAFKSEEVVDEGGPRITQVTSDKRYDYWRVSLNTLADAPVGGAGAGNFEREYTIHRRYAKPSRAAHSIWFRSLSEGGAAGFTLLLAFLAVLAVALVRARRVLDGPGRWVLAACAGVGGYFVIHASFDWLELFPAHAGPALALPFVALRLARGQVPATGTPARPRWPLAGATGVAVAVAFVSLGPPYLSVRFVDNALHRERSDFDRAVRDLDRAQTLNRLSILPAQVRGSLALRQGRYDVARRAFRDELEIEESWYPHYGLALLAAQRGDFEDAAREIAHATALNPPDPLLKETADLIRKRVRIDPRTYARRVPPIRVD
jgi:hypothetical protein